MSTGGEESSHGVECSAVERAIDVHFQYNTASQLVTDSCELIEFGPSASDASKTVVGTSCGYRLELADVSFPSQPGIELELGDPIALATLVDDPVAASLGCAENGWLSILDAQGRMQFATLSVADQAAPLSLGDLGELELEQTWRDGCRVLQLRAQGDQADVASGTSAEIQLGDVKLLVELGVVQDSVDAGCNTERYGVLMLRLAD